MTTRMEAMTEKITTEFGALHVGVAVDDRGFARLSLDHNDRLTDSAIGKLLAQIAATVNTILDDAR